MVFKNRVYMGILKMKSEHSELSDKCIVLVAATIGVWRLSFSRNVVIGSSSQHLLWDVKWIAEWLSWNINLSIKSPIYTVPELTGIVRVAGKTFSIKVRFSFIHKSIAELARFSIAGPVISGHLRLLWFNLS